MAMSSQNFFTVVFFYKKRDLSSANKIEIQFLFEHLINIFNFIFSGRQKIEDTSKKP